MSPFVMSAPNKDAHSVTRKDDPARLHNTALELEKQLRHLLRQKSSFDPEVRSIRNKLRDMYEQLLFIDYPFAQEKDVEQSLWKGIFYRRIEEFRKRIRKYSVVAEGGASDADEQLQKSTQATAAFRSFLAEATGFYHGLIRKLEARYGHIDGDRQDGGATQKRLNHGQLDISCNISCHRCLIYLGDLARYSELYTEGEARGKDWSNSAAYYQQASALFPQSGNPHNQLAVLATYGDNELLAVYRYFRSLAVEVPFLTARENLTLLFEKNAVKYSKLPSSAHSAERSSSALWRHLCVRFIRLNGIIFSKAGLESYEEVYRDFVEELELLFGSHEQMIAQLLGVDNTVAASGGASPFMQLLVVCTYSLHNIAWAPDTHNPTYSEILQRSVLAQRAFTTLYDLLLRLLRYSNRSKGAESLNLSTLPILLVFLEWYSAQCHVLEAGERSAPQAASSDACWKEIAEYLTAVAQAHALASPALSPEQRSALSEDLDLRGYQPLAVPHADLVFRKSPGATQEATRRISRVLVAARHIAGLTFGGRQVLFYDTGNDVYLSAPPEPCLASQASPSAASQPPHDLTLSQPQSVENSAAVHKDAVVAPAAPAAFPEEEEEEEEEVIVFRPAGLRAAEQAAFALSPQKAPTETGHIAEAVANGVVASCENHFAPPPKAVPMLPAAAASVAPPRQATHALPPPGAAHAQYALPHMQGLQFGSLLGGGAEAFGGPSSRTSAAPFTGHGGGTSLSLFGGGLFGGAFDSPISRPPAQPAAPPSPGAMDPALFSYVPSSSASTSSPWSARPPPPNAALTSEVALKLASGLAPQRQAGVRSPPPGFGSARPKAAPSQPPPPQALQPQALGNSAPHASMPQEAFGGGYSWLDFFSGPGAGGAGMGAYAGGGSSQFPFPGGNAVPRSLPSDVLKPVWNQPASATSFNAD
ncbi:hypothetical protein CYMTET_18454 [Cymbomonas tetramitiformis]|uniref:Protein SMG7 n=1 Tax=Cymbomonas tetramitiformis TaxID=36881 RepID=A0AAE0G8D1_9CHLO|nr:hypothetical protein CYMTET_18454 [Cymbomonas tetramitiformis]